MVIVCKISPILENHDANLIINEFNNATNEQFGSRAGFEAEFP